MDGEHRYYASVSGLGPAAEYSLTDHKRPYFIAETGLPESASIDDLEAAFFIPDDHSWWVTATGGDPALSVSDLKAIFFAPYVAEPAGGFAIFDGAAPGTSDTIHTDGGGSLRMGNRFYTTQATGISVLGARIWNPVASDSTFLNTDLTLDAYTNDWTGTKVLWAATVAGAILQTKTVTSTRVAGTWTDVLFDAPITLPTISAGAGTLDLLSLVLGFAGGTYYVTVDGLGVPAIESAGSPGTYLAEDAGLGRGINSLAGDTVNAHYGIDLLFEVI